jgi:hypothetical protein
MFLAALWIFGALVLLIGLVNISGVVAGRTDVFDLSTRSLKLKQIALWATIALFGLAITAYVFSQASTQLAKILIASVAAVTIIVSITSIVISRSHTKSLNQRR